MGTKIRNGLALMTAPAILLLAKAASAEDFNTPSATSAKDVVAAAFNTSLAFYFLVISALIGTALLLAGIWWAYNKVKAIIFRGKKKA